MTATWPQIIKAIDEMTEVLRDVHQHRELLYPAIERGEPGAKAALVMSLRLEERIRAQALLLRQRVETMLAQQSQEPVS